MIAIILCFFLIIVGCSKPECKKNADCPQTGECFNPKCVKGVCEAGRIPGCCGNGLCEKTAEENSCSCPADCKPECGGRNGTYLINQCDEDEACTLTIDSKMVKPFIKSMEKTWQGNLKILTKVEYNQPYNAFKDKVKLQFQLLEKPDVVTNPIIKKIQMISVKELSADEEIIAEMDLDRPLYGEDYVIEEELILDMQSSSVEVKSRFRIKIFYEYEVIRSGSENEVNAQSHILTWNDDNIILFPTEKRSCPSSCNDNNDCTTDSCSELTNYFCLHKRKANCCGNMKCESNENPCTCQIDCGSCTGKTTTFLERKCYQRNCVNVFLGKTETERVTWNPNFYIFTVLTTTEYPQPFDIKKSKINFKIELLDAEADLVFPVKITRIQLLESDTLLGESVLSENLDSVGSSFYADIPITFTMSELELSKRVKLKLFYEYTQRRRISTDSLGNPVYENYIERKTFEKSFTDNVYFINPDVSQ
jgi:hypothetical protein